MDDGKRKIPLSTEGHKDREEWLGTLMNQYGEGLTKLAYHYVKDWGRAEDVVQDVFVSCYDHYDDFRGESSVKTWVYRITINQCKDVLKSSVFRKTLFGKFDFIANRETDHTPELFLVQKETEKQLARHILSLTVKYREVILLFYYEEFSIYGISELLSIKPNTVKTRLDRARQKLRRLMEEDGYHGR
ncbi:MAG TPA: sigma-70 family RNA polymerase sigma factor [Bacillales bacterium]|nr:sigma-70 family RNA polymerase sigma factor [Bacillales bacterium]